MSTAPEPLKRRLWDRFEIRSAAGHFDVVGERAALVRSALIVSAGYFIGGQIDLLLGPTSPAAIWPPSAVLLAVLLTTPARFWWVYVLAVLPADFAISRNLPVLPVGVGLYFSNTLQSVAAASLIRLMWPAPPRWDDVRFVSRFIAAAAVIAPAAGALTGAATVEAQNHLGDYWLTWRSWLLANSLTNLSLVPALCGLISLGRERPSLARSYYWLETGALFVGLALLCIGAFEFGEPGGRAVHPLLYTPLPFLLWAAVRMGPRQSSVAQAVVLLIAIHGAARGRGPFDSSNPSQNVVGLQLFLISLSLPLMFLAAVVGHERKVGDELRVSEKRYRDVVDSQKEMVCRYLPDTTLTFVNEAYCRCFGRAREQLLGVKFLELIPEPARAAALAHVRALTSERGAPNEHEVTLPDGSIGWQAWTDLPICDANGQLVELQGVGQDVTERKRAEEALKLKEAALKASYDKIMDLASRLIVAQEEERTRIARDLHDDFNQDIAAISISISGLKRRLPQAAVELHEDMARLQRDVIHLSDEIRQLSHDLHPGVLRHAGLVAALRSRVSEFRSQSTIEVSLDAQEEFRELPSELSLCLYRAAQEALKNIMSHSGARHARIDLRRKSNGLELCICDDGVGFEPETARASGVGVGLISLEERVRLVGGSLLVDARPQQGTTLRIRVPLGGNHDQHDNA